MNQAKKTSTDKVFAVLQPNVFYRPRDVAEETGIARSTCYRALSSLAEGGGRGACFSGARPTRLHHAAGRAF